MGGIPREDEYWENRREELEKPEWYCEEELEYERGIIFLEDEIESIEAARGYPIGELYEGDLLEILEELKGIKAETAKWDERNLSIDYTVRVA